MQTHFLKTLPQYFDEVACGVKRFEFRRDDREFAVGDELVLQEWTEEGGYSGLELTVSVTHIMKASNYSGIPLPPGYCIMSIDHRLGPMKTVQRLEGAET